MQSPTNNLIPKILLVAVIALALLYLDTKKVIVARLLVLATALGFLSSTYFIYIQKFKIGAFCIYCILSALISTILFGIGIAIQRKIKLPETN